jgi:hypothetical protein
VVVSYNSFFTVVMKGMGLDGANIRAQHSCTSPLEFKRKPRNEFIFSIVYHGKLSACRKVSLVLNSSVGESRGVSGHQITQQTHSRKLGTLAPASRSCGLGCGPPFLAVGVPGSPASHGLLREYADD